MKSTKHRWLWHTMSSIDITLYIVHMRDEHNIQEQCYFAWVPIIDLRGWADPVACWWYWEERRRESKQQRGTFDTAHSFLFVYQPPHPRPLTQSPYTQSFLPSITCQVPKIIGYWMCVNLGFEVAHKISFCLKCYQINVKGGHCAV